MRPGRDTSGGRHGGGFTIPFSTGHLAVEELLATGEVAGWVGDGRVSGAARADVAAAAAHVLASGASEWRTYELGAESFALDDPARTISQDSGTPVVHRRLTDEQCTADLVAQGIDEGMAGSGELRSALVSARRSLEVAPAPSMSIAVVRLSVDQVREGVEPLGPEGGVGRRPGGDLAQGPCVQAVQPLPADRPDPHQAGVLEHVQVLGGGLPADRQVTAQPAQALIPLHPQRIQEDPAGRIGHRTVDARCGHA